MYYVCIGLILSTILYPAFLGLEDILYHVGERMMIFTNKNCTTGMMTQVGCESFVITNLNQGSLAFCNDLFRELVCHPVSFVTT